MGVSTSGQGAIDDVRTYSPDVALVDLRMMNHSVVYTEQSEELSEQLVPLGDFAGQFFTGRS